jgi:pimeloyl-ACP methyl ester carboxylesterase
MSTRLHAIEAGSPDLLPLVLLHGFGMVSAHLSPVIGALSAQRFVVAFDLPGHGGSLVHPLAGSARKCADAVIAELEIRALGPVTLVGHSFGGAVASLIAMSRRDLVKQLILLAPGGFGPGINAGLLRQFAIAATFKDIEACLTGMVAPGFPVPNDLVQKLVEMRQIPNQTNSLIELSSRFLRDGQQGVLPLEALAASGIPVDLVWGELDTVVPITDGMLAPAAFRKTIIAGAGHMLVDEALENITRVILRQV